MGKGCVVRNEHRKLGEIDVPAEIILKKEIEESIIKIDEIEKSSKAKRKDGNKKSKKS